ncbi:bifunctional cytidylate kinase/GTPase Der [Corynebacterium uterequi]|uniref:Multifunctional fusion protein n=1 Tax=Corynebacterium uterequi TaxID=1072256 RepID=A0A0G3HCK3_9CORY|nr:bifunctional cytidylate kinase/GTPase Der [Corynebacterium uterequi]AKK11044.1 cytidylate kinase/ribosome-associated GTPase EngA [Corynebacterium uterequi]
MNDQTVANLPDGGLLLAVDGPSGTGKSTTCRAVAKALDAKYIDTGAMYRVATLAVLRAGIDPADTDAVIAATADLPLTVNDDPDATDVILGGEDVSAEIRGPEVTSAVSAVSAIPQVRENLVALQRDLAYSAHRAVVEGRDIGTVVLSEAPAKAFLTADAEVRAQRRYDQDVAAGRDVSFEEVLAAVVRRDELDSSRATSPLRPAEDAVVIDTSSMGPEEVQQALIDLVAESAYEDSDYDDADDYSDTEWAEVEHQLGIERPDMITEALPTVAIVGRPNVGKSTLVNRFIARREAVVEDFPGVTRDRISYITDWGGRRFWVQDTGGWDPNTKGIHAAIARQAEAAMVEADVIVMVVDTTVGVTETDAVMANNLKRAEQPVILVANKFESDSQYADMAEFYALGLGDPWPVSALHGRGGADVLDEILAAFPEVPRATSITDGPRRVALVGRPNVGKSSLLNKFAREERSVVDNVAGTTVDPVDSIIELDEQTWRFVDTAGLRKKVKTASGHEYYASLRTQNAIDAAEVCVVLVDSSQPISEQDQRVLSMVLDAGKAVVLAFNKWDLMDENRRYYFDREFEETMSHVPWVTRVNISAKTGRALQKLEPAMIEALESWDQRISTGQLNNWLREAIAANPPPMNNNRLPKVLFATQVSTRPPTIVLFTTGFLDAGYRRYLERKFRERFGFHGTPVRIAVRVRERRSRP